MSDTTSRLFDKIKKILAKAERTESEAESATFFAKAMEMMAEHEITLVDLGDIHNGPAPILHEIVSGASLWGDLPYSNARAGMLHRISLVLGTTVYVMTNNSGRKTQGVGIIGTQAGIDRTLGIFRIAQSQADQAVLRARPSSWENVRTYRRSMFAGFASAFVTRLAASVKKQEQAATETGVKSMALVIKDDSARATDWARDNLRLTSSRRSTSGSRDGHNAGHDAGQGADLGQTRVGSSGRAIGSGR